MTACRYDFICATPDLGVEKVRYVFDDMVKSVSHHALVIADLTFKTRLSNTASTGPPQKRGGG